MAKSLEERFKERNFLPALKPRLWGARKRVFCRRLLDDEHEGVPLVAYGWDSETQTEFVTREAIREAKASKSQAHRQALKNLQRRARDVEWTKERYPLGKKKVPVLMIEGDEFTASLLLLPDFVEEAHELLGCESVVFGVPHRFALWACDAGLAPLMISLAESQFAEAEEEGAEPVTAALVFSQEGRLSGIAVSNEAKRAPKDAKRSAEEGQASSKDKRKRSSKDDERSAKAEQRSAKDAKKRSSKDDERSAKAEKRSSKDAKKRSSKDDERSPKAEKRSSKDAKKRSSKDDERSAKAEKRSPKEEKREKRSSKDERREKREKRSSKDEQRSSKDAKKRSSRDEEQGELRFDVARGVSKVFTANAIAGHGPERVLGPLKKIVREHMGMKSRRAEDDLIDGLLQWNALAAQEVLAGGDAESILAVLEDEGVPRDFADGVVAGVVEAMADLADAEDERPQRGKKASSKKAPRNKTGPKTPGKKTPGKKTPGKKAPSKKTPPGKASKKTGPKAPAPRKRRRF